MCFYFIMFRNTENKFNRLFVQCIVLKIALTSLTTNAFAQSNAYLIELVLL